MLNFENIDEKFVKVVSSPEWLELQQKFIINMINLNIITSSNLYL